MALTNIGDNNDINSAQALINTHYSKVTLYYDYYMERDKHEVPGARRMLMELLAINDGNRVLEIGVGTGINFLFYPSVKGAEYFGIDINQRMLHDAQEKLKYLRMVNDTLSIRIRYCLANASNLGFIDDSFDRGIAVFALSAIPENEKALSELERVVKSGGRIGILDFENTPGNNFSGGTVALELKKLLMGRQYSKVLAYHQISPGNNNLPLKAKSIYILEIKK